MSDLESQTLNIVQSRELWDQFRTEARSSQISTTVGLRQMLAGKHMEARRNSEEPAELECAATNAREALPRRKSITKFVNAKFWETDIRDSERELEQNDMSTMNISSRSFHEHDYRHAIRGKTNSVLSYYKNIDDANQRDSLRRSISDFTDRFVGATARRDTMMDEESTVNSLRSSLSMQFDEVFDDTSMRSLEEIAAAAASNVFTKNASSRLSSDVMEYFTMKLPDNEAGGDEKCEKVCAAEASVKNRSAHAKAIHTAYGCMYDDSDSGASDDDSRFELKAVPTFKDEEVDVYGSGKDSDHDDRSNKGEFEYYPSTRQLSQLNRSLSVSPDISSRRNLTRGSVSSNVPANKTTRTSIASDASEPKSIGSDLLVDWPSTGLVRRRATIPKAKSKKKYTKTNIQVQSSATYDSKPDDYTSSRAPPSISLAHQFMNLKFDSLPKNTPEKQMKRASVSSVYDIHPRPNILSVSTTSNISASTCPTVPSPPSVVSSLLVEWGDAADTDDEK